MTSRQLRLTRDDPHHSSLNENVFHDSARVCAGDQRETDVFPKEKKKSLSSALSVFNLMSMVEV